MCEEELKQLRQEVMEFKTLLSQAVVSRQSVESEHAKLDLATAIMVERYRGLSAHITELVRACRGIFNLFTKLIVVAFGVQIFLLSPSSVELIATELVFIGSYWIFVTTSVMVTFFSLQIVYCLHQWDSFRARQKQIYNDIVPHFDGPSFFSWVFELFYVAIMAVALCVSDKFVSLAFEQYLEEEGILAAQAFSQLQPQLLPWYFNDTTNIVYAILSSLFIYIVVLIIFAMNFRKKCKGTS